jgi:hypothetical protein
MLVVGGDEPRNNTGFGLLLHSAAAKMHQAVTLARYAVGGPNITRRNDEANAGLSASFFHYKYCKIYLTESTICL